MPEAKMKSKSGGYGGKMNGGTRAVANQVITSKGYSEGRGAGEQVGSKKMSGPKSAGK